MPTKFAHNWRRGRPNRRISRPGALELAAFPSSRRASHVVLAPFDPSPSHRAVARRDIVRRSRSGSTPHDRGYPTRMLLTLPMAIDRPRPQSANDRRCAPSHALSHAGRKWTMPWHAPPPWSVRRRITTATGRADLPLLRVWVEAVWKLKRAPP